MKRLWKSIGGILGLLTLVGMATILALVLSRQATLPTPTVVVVQLATSSPADEAFNSFLPTPTEVCKKASPTATNTPGSIFDSPVKTPTPTRWNWEPTATALARVTPSPFTIPTSTPIGGLSTPTPVVEPPPPTMVPSKAFRTENLEVADLRFVDFDARFEFVDWSPDGAHILAAVADPEQSRWHWRMPASGLFLRDLWIMRTDGTEQQQVANWVGSATWSPSGKHVAYSVPAKDEGIEGEICIIEVDSLKSWKVTDSDFIGVPDVYWLPNGDLTFVKGGHIFAVQLDGKGIHQLNDIYVAPITPEQPVPGVYEISPDGRKIAWIPGKSPTELWIADLDGSQSKMVTDNCYRAAGPQGIMWSPDSQQLAFTVFNGHGSLGGDLWVVSADGSDPYSVATTNKDWEALALPTWSPDGQAIAFTRGVDSTELSLWMVNRDGSGLCPLAEERTGTVLFPQWSPTGTQIAYTRDRWEPSGRPNAVIITLKQKP